MKDDRVVEAAKDVFLVRGSAVNWVLLREGTDLTMIDGGYPGDLDDVEASIRAIGRRPEDVQAILITHAHVDHLGAVNPFHRRYGTPVYLDAAEVSHARRDHLEQLTPAKLLANLWRPGVLPWAMRIVRNGATHDVATPHAQPFPSPGALDLPGAPLPVQTHGHTSGHSAFHIPSVGAVITGDSLVTGHPTSRVAGPQLLPAMFQHAGREELLAALGELERLDADIILPGHGPLHRGPIAQAVAVTRSRSASG
ncbi:MBL fold metallo-hydrolase [Nocardia rosealba]|uniref:MBL fold metallo-hydrolase n=1 Tax=Nocardia rosealba TaxID=2878563 RepID=UPI001CDA0919|nr:MBL fold metallo-hydrolase [Nocardia rosealba]MCA2207238.1 MBL fold metallo-hydrolase [Nocardia rosealba]